ncbi:MAG: FkbM family methyltransferase [Thermofilum sp.]|nr:FkbM family methyltransferase [Thermofilum sp.]
MQSRLFNRFFIWLRILKDFRGLTLKSALNLLISALCDTLLYAFTGSYINPRLLLEGLFFFKAKGLGIVAVRGGTDDLYNLLPGREGDVEEFIKSHLANGHVFVDVGANVGFYSLIASKLVGSTGRVYAIEAVPSTIAVLRANVKLNDCRNVVVHEVAAWSTRGKLKLSVPLSLYGLASVARNGLNFTVEAFTLDDLLHNENRIDLIKIDVEGAELEVLKGAQKVLRKTRYIVLELSHNVSEILRILQETGFICKKARFTTYILCERKEPRNIG